MSSKLGNVAIVCQWSTMIYHQRACMDRFLPNHASVTFAWLYNLVGMICWMDWAVAGRMSLSTWWQYFVVFTLVVGHWFCSSASVGVLIVVSICKLHNSHKGLPSVWKTTHGTTGIISLQHYHSTSCTWSLKLSHYRQKLIHLPTFHHNLKTIILCY